ncbi:MAG: 4'-phosphopantetheinyl transferase superfamily protein [Deltaproteobacteria bacterium]|nr:4'-phosphopantetheinyl transferase superfamily protein [Deltaproteobacteria bacterium]
MSLCGPVVGNDIVDLTNAEISCHHESQRFVERVLSSDERVALEAHGDPKRLLWSFFAAKEAAYKAVSKLRSPPPLGHRRFLVTSDLRSVRFESLTLGLEVESTRDWIHATASCNGSPAAPWVGRVEARREGEDESESARRLLIRVMAPRIGCAESELRVERAPAPHHLSGFLPPVLYSALGRVPWDVSLSHDGGFLAVAAVFSAPTGPTGAEI